MDKVFVPVNYFQNHWGLAVIYRQHKTIRYYDSVPNSGTVALHNLLLWLEDEEEERLGEDMSTFYVRQWQTFAGDRNCPQQENGSDCGVFILAFASYLSDDLPLDFCQADMTQMRRRIVWSIMNQRLR
ncbi:unnamed protein product [Hapterophycus canaliculatus]